MKQALSIVLILLTLNLLASCGRNNPDHATTTAEQPTTQLDPASERSSALQLEPSYFADVDYHFSDPPPTTQDTPALTPTAIPEFFNDIGKTLSVLKKEHSKASIFDPRWDNVFPDAAAAYISEKESNYAYYFFGTQYVDIKKVMSEYENQLKCAGFITTVGVLFHSMEDDMTFSDFFSLIGVSEYDYVTEECCMQGFLCFTYHNMAVEINTNEITNGYGWKYTGVERTKSSAIVSIIDKALEYQNYKLIEAVMFE